MPLFTFLLGLVENQPARPIPNFAESPSHPQHRLKQLNPPLLNPAQPNAPFCGTLCGSTPNPPAATWDLVPTPNTKSNTNTNTILRRQTSRPYPQFQEQLNRYPVCIHNFYANKLAVFHSCVSLQAPVKTSSRAPEDN
ncbi:hypothetical protein HBI62_062730 [Parastagonospora nodorum]|nr:hypothetical protein HBI62_062730 [Parastagonospora nodorum]KAH6162870.1 hypothetical protein HBI63_045570 [Parastagonospora nodorum]KAH6183183.1 hypothetical protein HBI61_078730 [Parastagonospora nodorum]